MKPKHQGEEDRLNPGHAKVRDMLRKVGPIVLVVGLLFAAVGLIDFFRAFGRFAGPPKYFWCLFVGMPTVFVGLKMTSVGYMGAVARYMSAESSPVAKDTFNYMADGTKEGVRDITSAIRDGIVGESKAEACCPNCKQPNDLAAKFCDACGGSMSFEKDCSDCEAPNDLDAKFCDGCGSPF